MDAYQRSVNGLWPAYLDGEMLDRRTFGAKRDYPGIGGVLQRHARRRNLAQTRRGGHRVGDQINGWNAEQAQRARSVQYQDAPAQPAPPATNGRAWPKQCWMGQYRHRCRLGLSRQKLFDGGICQAAQRPRCQQFITETKRHDRRTRLDRPMQYSGSAHRCEQQHRRLAANIASSASPRGPAVSAASRINGASPVSSTGVPRRRSAAARCTARRRSTSASASAAPEFRSPSQFDRDLGHVPSDYTIG